MSSPDRPQKPAYRSFVWRLWTVGALLLLASGGLVARAVHLQVFGAIDWNGTRLRDLAARANMTSPAMAELVDDLQAAGYLLRGCIL